MIIKENKDHTYVEPDELFVRSILIEKITSIVTLKDTIGKAIIKNSKKQYWRDFKEQYWWYSLCIPNDSEPPEDLSGKKFKIRQATEEDRFNLLNNLYEYHISEIYIIIEGQYKNHMIFKQHCKEWNQPKK
jgi:hypothetical protein